MSSEQRNKIALFTGAFRSKTGLLIALATRCEFVHAAVYVAADNSWYHSSESIGRFDKLNRDDYQARYCIAFEFSGDLSGWVKKMQGKRYDWRGVLGWLVRLNNPERFYCFEAAQDALRYAEYTRKNFSRLSGCDIRDMAKSPVFYGRFSDL